jgi:oxalate decarboxylase
MVDDWVAHTPKSVLAKNFGLNESVFSNVPAADPYILNGTVTTSAPADVGLTGNSSYVFHHSSTNAAVNVPGGAGNLSIIDSRNFPVSTTIAAAVISLEPKGLRELHWHPNVGEVYVVNQ